MIARSTARCDADAPGPPFTIIFSGAHGAAARVGIGPGLEQRPHALHESGTGMHAKVSGRGLLSTTWSTTPSVSDDPHLVGLVRRFPLFGVIAAKLHPREPCGAGRGTALAVRVTAARARLSRTWQCPSSAAMSTSCE